MSKNVSKDPPIACGLYFLELKLQITRTYIPIRLDKAGLDMATLGLVWACHKI